MNSLTPVYFPGTDIYSIRQYPIFLLFQQIHLIRPVEDKPDETGRKPSDTFINSGFCQVHTPCPLGENRQRFLNLVKDIKHRQDEYAAQLSSLTLAGMASPPEKSEDSELSIIRSLRTPGAVEAEAELQKKEADLWQARLVLAIGEILDVEEEEIARKLAMVEDEQAGLFNQLLGDSDDVEEYSPFAELNQLESKLNRSSSGNIKNRWKSWKTLYLESDFTGDEIFLTPIKESGDIVLEIYEKQAGQAPPTLSGLELPGLIGWSGDEAQAAVLQFTGKNRQLLGQLHTFLSNLVTLDDYLRHSTDTVTAYAELSEEWRRLLEVDFPETRYGRIPVKLFIFPGLGCKTLISGKKENIGRSVNGLLIVAD